MKKQLILFGITVLLICVGLSGCFDSSDDSTNEIDKFVGTWNEYESEVWHDLSGITTITFSSDRTFSTNEGTNGTYELKDDKLVLTIDDGELVLSFNYQFSDENQRFAIVDSNENVAIYTKQ